MPNASRRGTRRDLRAFGRGLVFRTEEDPMANVELRYASGQSARNLDVSPMISALRFQPDDFEFKHGWLHHVPEVCVTASSSTGWDGCRSTRCAAARACR